MAQLPLQLAHKQMENAIIEVINDALKNGLPMFVIEFVLKDILTEVRQNSNQQYQEALSLYQQALDAEQKAIDTNEEAPGA